MLTNYQDRLIRIDEVLQIVSVSRSHWYQGIKAGRYPKPVKLGARAAAWRASDIQELIQRVAQETA